MNVEIFLKIIAISIALLLFYTFVLSKEKIFRFNRFYLIAALIFSYATQFISIPLIFQSTEPHHIIVINGTNPEFGIIHQQTQFTLKYFAIYIWIAGSALFLCRFCFSLLKIFRLQGKNDIINGLHVKILNSNSGPFSFLKTIYIGEKCLINNEIPNEILIHESCHVRQLHSADIILTEVLMIFSWWNPALYFYKKAILQNHEFLADEAVLTQNISLQSYSELLLASSSMNPVFISNSFNYQNIKKRFIMMTTKKSRFAVAKQIAVIPVLTAVLLSFAPKKEIKPLIQYVSSKSLKQNVEKTKSNINTSVISKETPPEFPGGMMAFRNEVLNKFDASKMVQKTGQLKSEALITIDDNGKAVNVSVNGNDETFNMETLRAVQSVAENAVWKPGNEDGKPVRSVLKLPLTMTFQ